MVEKRKIMSLLGLAVIAAVFVFAAHGMITGNVLSSAQNDTTPPGAVPQTGSVQVVQMTMQSGNYTLNPSQVRVNVPVRLVADMNTIRGCYTTVVIKDIGVRKTLSLSDNTIEFTPTKTGTFHMTCGMNMAGGQIVVVDESGNASASTYSPSSASAGGTCGSGSSGGCGCGG